MGIDGFVTLHKKWTGFQKRPWLYSGAGFGPSGSDAGVRQADEDIA